MTTAPLPTSMKHGATFLAGFLVRPCCVLPAALAVVGTSGAGVASVIAPYRPWFLAMAVVFFGVSFYWNFVRNHNRAGMAVWGVSVLIAGALLLGPYMPMTNSATNDAVSIKEISAMANDTNSDTTSRTFEVPITGMACNACARRLEKGLNKTNGVNRAQVSFENSRAYIVCDGESPCDPQRIEEVVAQAGFHTDMDQSLVNGG